MPDNTKPLVTSKGHPNRQETFAGPTCQLQSSTQNSRRQALEGISLKLRSGQIGGVIFGDVLRKTIQTRHLLRKPPAIAIDVEVLATAEQRGVLHCEVQDTESGVTYDAPLADFWTFGFLLDRGFGKQQALPLQRWRKTIPGTPAQLRFPL